MVFRHQERIQYKFMGCRFIDKDIRCLIEDFNSLILHGMETLMSGIGAIGTILARWMPIRINHRTLQGIILRLQPLPLSVLRNQGSTMVTTHMEGKLVRIGSVCRMTVETGTRRCRILKDCRFPQSYSSCADKCPTCHTPHNQGQYDGKSSPSPLTRRG